MRKMKGMSLIEILMVVAIFAVLGIITTRAVALTLKGSKKSESTLKVRENINYSLSVIERQLRNANSITACPNPDTKIIDYADGFGKLTSFSCVSTGGADSYVASGSARLTSNEIMITACSFSCTDGTSDRPPSVMVSISAKDAQSSGTEAASVTLSTKIHLRTY